MPVDSTSWRQVFKGFFQRKPVPNHPHTYYQIPLIEIPVALNAQLLVVRTYSTDFGVRWKYAGNFSAVAQLVLGVPTVDLETVTLPLNRTIPVEVKPYSNSYSLKFQPFYWIRNIGLEVWEYYGVNAGVDIETSLNELKLTANRIEEKVTDISDFGQL